MKKSELQETNDRRTYKVFTTIDQDPYPYEGVNFYPAYRRGFRNPSRVLKKYQVRNYRTWKYNRKTKYKL